MTKRSQADMRTQKGKILVIKLGALGDFVLALGPFSAIRAAHSDERIVLLTTKPFAEFAEASGYFDEIWIDERPSRLNLLAVRRLRRTLRRGKFYRVYDLQTSNRSSWYFRLMGGLQPPQWSGIAFGCSHRHSEPNRDSMHTIERQADQLAVAGITETPVSDLSWAQADISHFDLPPLFTVLIPGSAAHRPQKRWPTANYRQLAAKLTKINVLPVIIGGRNEMALASEIADGTGAKSLAGETSLFEIVELSRSAIGAVGNDTGPMHIMAINGCPSVVLFSGESDPSITAPRGKNVQVLRCEKLGDLPVTEVAEALSLR
jgi:ADP-heptose:LPS heptosyltransferase